MNSYVETTLYVGSLHVYGIMAAEESLHVRSKSTKIFMSRSTISLLSPMKPAAIEELWLAIYRGISSSFTSCIENDDSHILFFFYGCMVIPAFIELLWYAYMVRDKTSLV